MKLPNRRKTLVGCFIPVVVLILAMTLLLVLGPGVWIPDVIIPSRWIHVDSTVLPNGQELHLYQKTTAPFYGTFVMCKESGQWKHAYFIGVDEPKLWRWGVEMDRGQHLVTMSVSPGRVYTYQWESEEFRGSERLEPFDWLAEYSAKEESTFSPLPAP